MPLPASLAEILDALGDNFVPNSARAEYLEYRDLWQLYLDLYELDNQKIGALLDKHSGEDQLKYELRQKLAAVFNYVPMVVRMAINYIYSEQPQISVEGNEPLQNFINDCDGNGTTLSQFVRQNGLPLALVLGFVDVLVQNPATPEGMFETAEDVRQAAGTLSPRVLSITPLQRINWSTNPQHEYNWIAFVDNDDESRNPFISGIELDANLIGEPDSNTTGELEFAGKSFIRVCRYLVLEGDKPDEVVEIRDDAGKAVGFWVKSWQGKDENNRIRWFHDGGFLPTARVPVATLYYSRSIDQKKRHFGVSKIAMIAILTKKILQLASWTDEDVLANLAMFVLPGNPPQDEKGNVKPVQLTPFGVIWIGNDAKVPAHMLQGDTDHIRVKMDLIDKYIQEILRLAYLIGASGQAERVTSGVQGVVMRNELFMELADLALSCDNFTLELLALAQSWISNQDISRAQLVKEINPKVAFYKGPYSIDPLADVIKNSESLITLFERISPLMVKNLYRQLALSALTNEDTDRDDILNEIDDSVDQTIAEDEQQRQAAIAALGALDQNQQPPNNGEFGSATVPGA